MSDEDEKINLIPGKDGRIFALPIKLMTDEDLKYLPLDARLQYDAKFRAAFIIEAQENYDSLCVEMGCSGAQGEKEMIDSVEQRMTKL